MFVLDLLTSPQTKDLVTTGNGLTMALLGCATTIIVAVINKGRGESRRAAVAAEHAVTLSAPTGNGFARRTEEGQRRTDEALQRIERDLGGIKSEQRAQARRLDRTNERFDTHIDHNPKGTT